MESLSSLISNINYIYSRCLKLTPDSWTIHPSVCLLVSTPISRRIVAPPGNNMNCTDITIIIPECQGVYEKTLDALVLEYLYTP